jgi:hypothetical protein
MTQNSANVMDAFSKMRTNKMRQENYHLLTDFFLLALLPNSRRP